MRFHTTNYLIVTYLLVIIVLCCFSKMENGKINPENIIEILEQISEDEDVIDKLIEDIHECAEESK